MLEIIKHATDALVNRDVDTLAGLSLHVMGAGLAGTERRAMNALLDAMSDVIYELEGVNHAKDN